MVGLEMIIDIIDWFNNITLLEALDAWCTIMIIETFSIIPIYLAFKIFILPSK